MNGRRGRAGDMTIDVTSESGGRHTAAVTAVARTLSGARVTTSRHLDTAGVEVLVEALCHARESVRRVAAVADRLQEEGWTVSLVPWYVAAGGIQAACHGTTVTLYGDGVAESRDPAARTYAQTIYDHA